MTGAPPLTERAMRTCSRDDRRSYWRTTIVTAPVASIPGWTPITVASGPSDSTVVREVDPSGRTTSAISAASSVHVATTQPPGATATEAPLFDSSASAIGGPNAPPGRRTIMAAGWSATTAAVPSAAATTVGHPLRPSNVASAPPPTRTWAGPLERAA